MGCGNAAGAGGHRMSTDWLVLNGRSELVQLVGGLVFAITALPFFILGFRAARKQRRLASELRRR